MRYASFGSISSGTMRTEDLLEAFTSELEYQVQQNAEAWCHDDGRAERDRYLALVKEASEADPEDEGAVEIVSDLVDALTEFAPPYAYFGSNEGDGADYGYWLSSDAIEFSFDGLKVSDTSEVPADYSGEVLHTNDHGNLTLYVATDGELKEVCGLV